MMHRQGRASRWRGRLSTGKQWCLVGALGLGVACATMPHGATEANMDLARSKAAEGWALFKDHCAGCHGERGESVSHAPRIMGQGALPEYPRERNLNADPASGDPELLRLRAQTRPAGAPWRDPFRTAQDLYAYVSKQMPLPAKQAGSLSAEQYRAITDFMLRAHGVQVPAEGVNAGNASSVKLQVGPP
jgi:mono/diheme cytochrome c family protein